MSDSAAPGKAGPEAAPLRRHLRGSLIYAALFGVGIVIFLLIRAVGETLAAPPAATMQPAARAANEAEVDVVLHVLATLSAIIALGWALGRVLGSLGQPPVIGEVIAGVVLGPSVLGAVSPQLAHLFVPSAEADPAGVVVSALQAISRLGIVLYMFLVGLELDLSQLRRQARAAVAISHASIVVPFLSGAALALWVYPRLSSRDVSFTDFALFMGVAMAITAFPVLARILTDQKREKSELGVLALSSAAVGDVTAWCLLALVVGMARAELGDAFAVVLGAGVYLAVMFLVVRPAASRLTRRLDGAFPSWTLPAVLVAVMVSGLTTKLIGIHTLFGGFVLGVVMSSDRRLAAELHRRLHDVATILLLPAFFAIVGLRTEITLLDTAGDWLMAGAIIVVATAGKVGGTMAAACSTGMHLREAAALGTLMNTRGLMELIALNIGLEIGIISPKLFAMMVVMALATTLATAPVVRWLVPDSR